MSENGDPSENLAYRQLGKDGNPFDRGRPSFDAPEPVEAQDGGRPEGDPTALVQESFVPDESTMSQREPDDPAGAATGDRKAPRESNADDGVDGAAEDIEEVEDVTELLPGGGRLDDPGPDEEGLGAPLP